MDSYDILTLEGSTEEQFECIAPEELRRVWRDMRRTIKRGVPGPEPQLGSVCLAGISWLNSDVVNMTLGCFGAACCMRPTYSLDQVGLA